jgi:hypothetical protein
VIFGIAIAENLQFLTSNDRAVLDHFTEKSFHRKKLTEHYLTEKSVDQTPFDRTSFDCKAI